MTCEHCGSVAVELDDVQRERLARALDGSTDE